jgi:hypothetical protein
LKDLTIKEMFVIIHACAAYVAAPWWEHLYKYVDSKDHREIRSANFSRALGIVVYDREYDKIMKEFM